MKTSNWIIMTLAVGCLVLADGCKKQEQSSERKTFGKRVSVTALRRAFESAPDKEVQAWLSDATSSLHYGEYAKSLAALEKLANHPGLTAQQRKITSEVIGQVKQLAANYRALPGH